MHDYKLPDGTWVTTPVYVGHGLQEPCPDHGCDWQDVTPPSTDTPVPVILQRCDRCGWHRGKYAGNITHDEGANFDE